MAGAAATAFKAGGGGREVAAKPAASGGRPMHSLASLAAGIAPCGMRHVRKALAARGLEKAGSAARCEARLVGSVLQRAQELQEVRRSRACSACACTSMACAHVCMCVSYTCRTFRTTCPAARHALHVCPAHKH